MSNKKAGKMKRPPEELEDLSDDEDQKHPNPSPDSSHIILRTVNDISVKPFKIDIPSDNRPILGADIFPEAYPNILLVARKNSGKTTVIQTIARFKSGPNTTIIAFCSTNAKDKSWVAIKKWAHRNGIKYHAVMSIKDEQKNDFLQQFIKQLQNEAEEEIDEEEDDEGKHEDLDFLGKGERKHDPDAPEYGDYDSGSEDEMDMMNFHPMNPAMARVKQVTSAPSSIKKKEPFIAPEYILIFDDLSEELKNPNLVALLKRNRHWKIMTITSTQFPTDVPPASWKQMDYVLLFGDLAEDRLKTIHDRAALALPFPTFDKIYHNATAEKYSFLYIDTRTESYRKNFNKMYMINRK